MLCAYNNNEDGGNELLRGGGNEKRWKNEYTRQRQSKRETKESEAKRTNTEANFSCTTLNTYIFPHLSALPAQQACGICEQASKRASEPTQFQLCLFNSFIFTMYAVAIASILSTWIKNPYTYSPHRYSIFKKLYTWITLAGRFDLVWVFFCYCWNVRFEWKKAIRSRFAVLSVA